MARTRLTVCVLASLAVAMLFVSGCFKVEGSVKVGVDGSSAVRMSVGIMEALAAMGGDEEGQDPLAEMREDLPEGWEAEDLEEDGWVGVTISSLIAPGEPLFPREAAEAGGMTVRVVQRQFCTDYYVEGTLTPPEGAGPGTVRDGAAGGIVFTQDEAEDEEGMTDEDFGALMGAFGPQPSISFSVSAPGTIVSTSGEQVGHSTAVWTVDMDQMGEEEEGAIVAVHLHSRLLNYQSIGRLADRLAAERELPDTFVLVADYIARDLLPNPPKEAPLKAGIDAEAYEAALSIVIAFEEVLGEDTAARVINGLKLNADGVSAKDLTEMWDRVQQMESEELIEVAAQAIVKHVRMRGK